MQNKSVNGACTIVSPNYLPFARTLARSYLAQHPDHQFFVLIVARALNRSDFIDEPYIPVLLEELGYSNLAEIGMKYGIVELNTNVKPRFMLNLLRQHSLDTLIYLDPDIFVYAPLDLITEELQRSHAVLTPHLTSPLPDPDGGFEQEVLYNGTFNLGFIGVRHSSETIRMLEWWEQRCINNGFSEGRTGLFVDQKWMNLAPSLFDGVVQCKHPGCNMGFWNLHERSLYKQNGHLKVNECQTLHFFHFSGIAIGDSTVLSKNTTRYTLESRPDLQELFADYRNVVTHNRVPELDGLPYGFDCFEDRTAVTVLARRLYAAHETTFKGQDPFKKNSAYYNFATRHGLTAGPVQQAKLGWKDAPAQDRRIKAVNALFKYTLKAIGPNRYELLMRYLSFISILRNQAIFIKD